MKTVKPLRLGVLTRPFENARQYYLSVAVITFFPFDLPERLLPEVSLWKLVATELGEEGILDEGMPKSTAEVLVAGRAFPPNPPKPHCLVRLRMGHIDRSLYVFGDRQWGLGGARRIRSHSTTCRLRGRVHSAGRVSRKTRMEGA